jgi:hypothetical protein
MRKVIFRTVTTTIRGAKVDLLYRENIRQLMLTPLDPEKGANYEEMAVVIPILEKFKLAVGDYILLEEAEHAEVVKRLKNAQFLENTPEIYDMIQSVVDAPEHLMEAVENG